MPAIIDFPPNLRITHREDPHLAFNTRSGGRAISGIEQVISPLSSHWRWRVSVPITDKVSARSFRAIKTQLQGRFNYLRMRVCDQYRVTRKSVGAWGPDHTPYDSGGVFHSDGTGFYPAQPNSALLAAADIGATSILLNAESLELGMSAGVFFSINNWLYQVDNWEVADGVMTVQFSPPLREAAWPEDVTAEFDAAALWTLATDDEGDYDLQIGKFGQVELNLVEAIGRAL